QCGAQCLCRSVERYSSRACRFAELLSCPVHDDRDVRISWRGVAQLSLQVDLPRCRLQQVHTSYDLGHTLFEIIHDHRQVIRDEVVAPANDEVAGFRLQPLRFSTLHEIDESYRLVVSPETNCARPRGASGATGAGIDAPQRPLRSSRKTLARAATPIRQPFLEQALDYLVVVRGVATLVEHRPVPLEAVRRQRPDDGVSRALALPWRIDGCDAKQPATPTGSCLKVTCDRRDQRAEVQRTGG